MRLRLLLVSALFLSACGADGPPERPTPGLTVKGEARIGVVME